MSAELAVRFPRYPVPSSAYGKDLDEAVVEYPTELAGAPLFEFRSPRIPRFVLMILDVWRLNIKGLSSQVREYGERFLSDH